MESSATFSLILLTNICNLVSIRLDSTNFVLWKYQITPILKAHKLFKYVDGSCKAPDCILRSTKSTGSYSSFEVSSTEALNPEYEKCHEQDQALITSTITQTVLSYVVGCQTAFDVWTKLEKHFSLKNCMHIISLKTELQSIVKKFGELIDLYVQRIKNISNKLDVVSVVLDDEDLVIYTRNGLLSSFNVLKTTIRTRSQSLTFDELHILLKNEKVVIDHQNKNEEVSPGPSFAMVANFRNKSHWRGQGHGNRGVRSFRGRGNGGGHGRGTSPSPTTARSSNNVLNSQMVNSDGSTKELSTPCQICKQHGNDALDCYDWMNFSFQGRHPSVRLAIMAASTNANLSHASNSQDSSVWLIDSGCNGHLIGDLRNLNVSSAY